MNNMNEYDLLIKMIIENKDEFLKLKSISNKNFTIKKKIII